MVIAFETAHKSMEADLRAELGGRTEPLSSRRIVRIESHFPDTDLAEWLRAQTDTVKIYWSGREGGLEIAGIGAAAEKHSEGQPDLDTLFAEIGADLASRHAHLHYYGGFRFDLDRPRSDIWKPFGAYHFIVPKFELGRIGNRYFFAINILVEKGKAPADYLDASLSYLRKIDFSSEALPSTLTAPKGRKDRPDRQAWGVIVEAALDQLNGGDLNKVVLARESVFSFDAPIDPIELLSGLIANTIHSFHYAFQFVPGRAFVGASPERLYRRENTHLQSEALAGTRPRVSDPEQSDALGRELMESPKERYEHQLVVDHLQRVFDEHCRAIRGGDRTELLILRHVQHLLTRIEGMLDGNVSDVSLLRSLHPTPALCGAPTVKAKDTIARLEPIERGWYAGPVGWIGHDSSEFAVAIRSALVHGNKLSVFSGCGIVPGSKPDQEWDEIEAKTADFLRVLDPEAP